MIKIILLGCTLTMIAFAQERRIPTAAEIDDYDDPVLREIFRKSTPSPYNPSESNNLPSLENTEYQSPYNNFNTQQPQVAYRSLGSPYAPQQPTYYYTQAPASSQFSNLAAQGAQTFYSGAQQVGSAFGIPPSTYEVPLISSAASLFG